MGIFNFWISLHRPFSFFFFMSGIYFDLCAVSMTCFENSRKMECLCGMRGARDTRSFFLSHCMVVGMQDSCVMNSSCANNSLGEKFLSLSLKEGNGILSYADYCFYFENPIRCCYPSIAILCIDCPIFQP